MKRLCMYFFFFSSAISFFHIPARAQSHDNPQQLPNRTMISLSGYQKESGVELKGTLSASHSYDRLIIERGALPGVFEKIEEINIEGTASAKYDFSYVHTNPGSGVNYYRIRLINSFTRINEITNTLMVKMNSNTKDLELVNTVMQSSSPVLTIKTNEDEEVSIQTLDMSGQPGSTKKMNLNKGINNISLSDCSHLKGFFVIVLKTKTKTVSQRVWVQ